MLIHWYMCSLVALSVSICIRHRLSYLVWSKWDTCRRNDDKKRKRCVCVCFINRVSLFQQFIFCSILWSFSISSVEKSKIHELSRLFEFFWSIAAKKVNSRETYIYVNMHDELIHLGQCLNRSLFLMRKKSKPCEIFRLSGLFRSTTAKIVKAEINSYGFLRALEAQRRWRGTRPQ